MNDHEFQRFNHLINRLMKSRNPARLLNDWIGQGYRYTTEDVLKLISQRISRESEDLTGIFGANPGLSEKDIELLKHDWRKLYEIKKLIEETQQPLTGGIIQHVHYPPNEEIQPRPEAGIKGAIMPAPEPEQPGKKKPPKPGTPKKFEQLFTRPDLIDDCIAVLRKVDPPILNDANKLIGLKSAFCIWVDEMIRFDLVEHFKDRSIYSNLIKQRFALDSFSDSLFAKANPKAEEYRTDIKTLLSKVSQKRKL